MRLYAEIKNGRFTPLAQHPQSPTWPGLENRPHPPKPDLFVAREAELETLTNALERAAAGQGGVLLCHRRAGQRQDGAASGIYPPRAGTECGTAGRLGAVQRLHRPG